ncbi:MAG: hypothetical protein WC717_05490 [Candidatus Micrarchaeia archaeon]
MLAPVNGKICKFENRAFELGDTFRYLKNNPGVTPFQNGVMLGMFWSGSTRLLGCSNGNCDKNKCTGIGFHTCTLLEEKIMD